MILQCKNALLPVLWQQLQSAGLILRLCNAVDGTECTYLPCKVIKLGIQGKETHTKKSLQCFGNVEIAVLLQFCVCFKDLIWKKLQLCSQCGIVMVH